MSSASQNRPARKRPQRSCVACRAVRDKWELLRIVRAATGEIRWDPTGKASGRGAYLCPSVACLKQAVKRKSLPRALRAEIPPETLTALEQGFPALTENRSSEN